MAQIDLGSIKFNWKGSYSGATAYVVDDVVESSGSSYICIAATTGNAPPNATYWEQMSAKGTDGTDADLLSISGTVQGDIYYNNGSAIARLAPGTSGQYLETQGSGANPVWSTVSTGAYSIAQFSDTSSSLSASTNSTDNTAIRIGTNEITVTPSASTDLIEVRANITFEAQRGDYNGIGIQYSTTSGSYTTSTSPSFYIVSTGEFAQGSGDSSDASRYQWISLVYKKTASDWGLSAGTTYYLSLHGLNHGNASRQTTFANNNTNPKSHRHFSLTRYTV
jgi:hypothetical protein